MSEAGEDRWLTVADVAGTLSVSDKTVRRWIKSGKLAALDLEGRKSGYRIRQSDLDAFIVRRYRPSLPCSG